MNALNSQQTILHLSETFIVQSYRLTWQRCRWSKQYWWVPLLIHLDFPSKLPLFVHFLPTIMSQWEFKIQCFLWHWTQTMLLWSRLSRLPWLSSWEQHSGENLIRSVCSIDPFWSKVGLWSLWQGHKEVHTCSHG